MDAKMNNIENIRAPDKVKKERLLEDDRSDIEKSKDEVI